MTSRWIQQRMNEVKQGWTEHERQYRAYLSRLRCTQLLRMLGEDVEPGELSAVGAMSPADVQRMSGTRRAG